MGSGKNIIAAEEVFGVENFEITPLKFFETRKELKVFEREIVNKKFLEYYKDICYNIIPGGGGQCNPKRFTDEELKEHHDEWYNQNREKETARMRGYYQQNKEKICERNRVNQQEKKEAYRETQRRWRQAHKEHLTEYRRSYYQQNKEKMDEYSRNYYQQNKNYN